MSCTFNEARDHMLKVFKDAWDTTGFPAVYPGKAEDPDNGGDTPSANVWARATIRHADGFQSSLTGPLEQIKRHTNIGVVIIQVFGKIGDGSVAAYEAAQLVATAYRTSRDNPVWFRRVRINEIGSRGPYSQVNVLVDFSYDTIEGLNENAPTPPPAPATPVGYFNFPSPLLQWIINHNYNSRVNVEVFTLGGTKIWANVTQVNLNQTIVTFDSPQDGYAIVDAY